MSFGMNSSSVEELDQAPNGLKRRGALLVFEEIKESERENGKYSAVVGAIWLFHVLALQFFQAALLIPKQMGLLSSQLLVRLLSCRSKLPDILRRTNRSVELGPRTRWHSIPLR
uniref:(northern house mosquito) hypothetical protein n=1 Tax=Culex pipiens TaxID=7175 RepID=A0A8D8CGG5_CULPI